MNSFDLERIARLSNIEFTNDSKDGFIKDMTEILSFTEKLSELDNIEVKEAKSILTTPLAKDEICTQNTPVLSQSKHFDGKYFIVPSVLG